MPSNDYAGSDSFTFTVQDNGPNGSNVATSANTFTLTVSNIADPPQFNSLPAGGTNAVNSFENGSYTFNAGDFRFTDPHDPSPNNNNFNGVLFTSLPAANVGTLTNGRRITGMLTNRLGHGWTPVDGYGVINAEKAVFGR